MKVLRLEVVAHGETKVTQPVMPFIGYDVGMVFAGAVTPALMTHAAASMMLSNLFPQLEGPRIWLPSFANVTELLCHLSATYIRDAAVAYSMSNPPMCEFVVFAQPPLPSLDPGPISAYRIRPSFDALGIFQQVAEEIDLEGGEIAVIGDDAESLREEAIHLMKAEHPAYRGVEPRIALERRMQARTHPTVGGTLQFGIMSHGRVSLYGASRDSHGNPLQNWLGFDCQTDIRQILGMPVVIPSRL
ncbi:hypothetical protein [Pseudoxanthomonas mexicana]